MNARRMFWLVAFSAATAAVFSDAHASQRRFTYTQESGVIARGQVELEPQTTLLTGKEDYYTSFEQRIEFEIGLTSRLQTSLYLNMHGTTEMADSSLGTDAGFDGISSEWKLKLRDCVADPFGLGLYLELSAASSEVELETKVIVDKRAGNWLYAFNATVEPEWEFIQTDGTNVESNLEFKYEFDVAGTYFLKPSTSVGIEVRNHNLHISSEDYDHSVLFAGPVVSYASETWWATLTVMPQLAKLKGSAIDEGHDLVTSELTKLEARLIFGVDL
jgi:Family of unknown function (DUF6662)